MFVLPIKRQAVEKVVPYVIFPLVIFRRGYCSKGVVWKRSPSILAMALAM
jgi:hypothetical protein